MSVSELKIKNNPMDDLEKVIPGVVIKKVTHINAIRSKPEESRTKLEKKILS
ncbi:hypothetical protein HF888_16435 (plasmid) [Bermanella marisrubri]|uniref:Uncharacterized protein n=1 Tax=Bermanella marisrubri TaxID=207949 RepID=Q1MY22_9GAMM|nr:hypothetical protein [Bermanella marisrubri]EAT10874.1 hypothetical protein RED65_02008 [Oceanobacter sp. RED65] [Bermanella marisrubri]QIZ85928.1 hypothetical protein HF888_16435 [Bermanella marisrubri]